MRFSCSGLLNNCRPCAGSVAQAGGVIAVTIFGLGVAFSESGSGLRRGVSILFGVAIAFAAASFFMGFFGFGGGAVIG